MDGNCFIHSVRDQIQFKSPEDAEKVEPIYIRRMALMHFMQYHEELFDAISKEIKDQYGLVEDQNDLTDSPGPFTMRQYLKYMSKDKVYCDAAVIKMIASMWSVRIAVVRSDCCQVLKFRTELPMDKCEFVVVFNSKWSEGHYSSVRKEKEKVPAREITLHKHFEKAKDYEEKQERLMGRPDAQGFIMVRKDRLKKLLACEKSLASVKRACGATGASAVSDEADGAPSPKKRNTPHFEKDVQEIEVGKVHCDKCNKDFDKPAKLVRHLNVDHQMKYQFECETCGKALQSKEGYKSHMLTHKEEQKIACTKCDATFTLKKSLKAHMKQFHLAPGKKLPPVKCGYCPKEFKYKGLARQHELGCELNPNREEHVCNMCGQGGFWLKKKLNDHKRQLHFWPT